MAKRSPITADEIFRFILNREREGEPLSPTAVKLDATSMYYAACKRFGNWSKALEAAGLDPFQFYRSRAWTPQIITDYIQKLNTRGHSLRRRDVARFDQGLLAAAHNCFGSWQSALEAAGINSKEFCNQAKWTREQVTEAILLRAVKLEPLGITTVRPLSLRSSAISEFGSWASALTAAGLDPEDFIGVSARNAARPTYSGRDGIKKALLQRVALGLPCSQLALKRQDRKLFRAVIRIFGSVGRAAKYAGIGELTEGKSDSSVSAINIPEKNPPQ